MDTNIVQTSYCQTYKKKNGCSTSKKRRPPMNKKALGNIRNINPRGNFDDEERVNR